MSKELQHVDVFGSKRGINNVAPLTAPSFQPGDTPPDLRVADNVDLDATGGLSRREGYTKIRDVPNSHSGWACDKCALYVADGTLYWFDENGSDRAVCSVNSTRDVSYAKTPDSVLWTNGEACGRLYFDGTPANWGVHSAAAPVATQSTGSLPPATYLVAVTYIIDEVEGCSKEAAEITLTTAGGICCEITDIPQNAEFVNIYVSEPNGSVTYFNSEHLVSPYVYVHNESDTSDPHMGMGVYPPVPGQIVRVWQGRVVIAADNVLYFSEPGEIHEFRRDEEYQVFGDRITLLEPMDNGLYLGLENGGTYWIEGPDSTEIKQVLLDDRRVFEGSAAWVHASVLPELKINDNVMLPVWLTNDGFAVGMNGGRVAYPNSGIVALDSAQKATIAYVERPSLQQLIAATRGNCLSSNLRAAEHMSITITRGGVPYEG